MGIDRSEVPVFNQDLTIVPYNLISILYKNPVLHLSIQEFERLRHAFLSIERCLESNHMFKYQMLTRIIQLFMLELGQTLSLYDKTDTPTPSTRKAELFMEFTEEVRNHLATGRKVNSYAHMLHVSPQYLNAVIKEVSGETASLFIRKYVISHLISQITRKSTPLKQIAADFGFGDVSALYNYIKKHTGHTVPEIIEKNK